MKKYIQLSILFLIVAACQQKGTKMETPEDATKKFGAFIAKEKFIEENFYPGISSEKLRPVATEKINQIALSFKAVATSKNPTAKKYQKAIKFGLSSFAAIYMELDTEDRERICMYIEELMDIIGLESSNGQLNNFIYSFDPNE